MQLDIVTGSGDWDVGIFGGHSGCWEGVSPELEELSGWDPGLLTAAGWACPPRVTSGGS